MLYPDPDPLKTNTDQLKTNTDPKPCKKNLTPYSFYMDEISVPKLENNISQVFSKSLFRVVKLKRWALVWEPGAGPSFVFLMSCHLVKSIKLFPVSKAKSAGTLY